MNKVLKGEGKDSLRGKGRIALGRQNERRRWWVKLLMLEGQGREMNEINFTHDLRDIVTHLE